MSAVVDSAGNVRQLDRKGESGEQVTEEQATNPSRLARALSSLLSDVAKLRSRFYPKRVDFEDHTFEASAFATAHRFAHGFNGRVRWWLVDWTASVAPAVVRSSSLSDDNTLVLLCNAVGTATVRIEEAG